MTFRLDVPAVEAALLSVEREWPRIDTELQHAKIGRKDPFTALLRDNMVSAYQYLDQLLASDVEPFSDAGLEHMLALNDRVHFGTDATLAAQYATAIAVNIDKFDTHIEAIAMWYTKHAEHGEHPCKLAAETYVSILGQPQLFVEGNHRTGALIASWINMRAGYPPFVLSAENALAYFGPAAEIKQFADRSSWRGRQRLPKYRKSFRVFWEHHIEAKYMLDPAPLAARGDTLRT